MIDVKQPYDEWMTSFLMRISNIIKAKESFQIGFIPVYSYYSINTINNSQLIDYEIEGEQE